MAKNQALRKNTRMPPKAPRLPKSPVGFNYRKKPSPEKSFACRCQGGPWDGTMLPMFRSSPATAVFNLRGQRGRYRMGTANAGECIPAYWEAM